MRSSSSACTIARPSEERTVWNAVSGSKPRRTLIAGDASVDVVNAAIPSALASGSPESSVRFPFQTVK